MTSGISDPLTTKKPEKEEGGFIEASTFFLPSPSGAYGWVSCTIFGGGQLMK